MSSLVKLAIGLDCDRPRGGFAFTPDGIAMSKIKFDSLKRISEVFNKLHIPRTYFICGLFLESMVNLFGKNDIINVLCNETSLCEIADHSHSHSVLKKIPTRPDKVPLKYEEISLEIQKNRLLFKEVFGDDSKTNGYRSPLGHYQGLTDDSRLQDLFLEGGFEYVSSDIRDHNHSICPGLFDLNNKIRQPYFYENGLLEIPGHGWHDTAFGNETKTPLFELPPMNYDEILIYYRKFLKEAKLISAQNGHSPLYIGLILHPYNIALYDLSGSFFSDLYFLCREENIEFCTYKNIHDEIRRKGKL